MLQDNLLTGKLPEELGSLSNLKSCYIGELPLEILMMIALANMLTELSIMKLEIAFQEIWKSLTSVNKLLHLRFCH